MPDLLVKLYELPDSRHLIDTLQSEGINIRRAMSYEKRRVVQWVEDNFGQGWGSECDVSFSNHPATSFIATENNKIIGFACYDSTAKNFLGPMGVAEQVRKKGVGKVLLLSCLHAMSEDGYAYAIIGGAEATEFYVRTAGAVEIPGSSPGIYRDRLK